jgi:hypothetical protein
MSGEDSSDPIKTCSVCCTPPAASVQVGGGTTVFWIECRTCGRKTAHLETLEAARASWNAMQ